MSRNPQGEPRTEAEVRDAIDVLASRIDTYCVVCDGDRRYLETIWDEGVEIDHTEVDCLDSIHACADQARVLAAALRAIESPAHPEREKRGIVNERCKAWATTSRVPQRYARSYPCPHPAKFRVAATKEHTVPPEDLVCGRHVRLYLMDNGDSVRKPWLVTPLATDAP